MQLLYSTPDTNAQSPSLPGMCLFDVAESRSQQLDLSFWLEFAHLAALYKDLSEHLKITLAFRRSISLDMAKEIVIDLGMRIRTDGVHGLEYVIKCVNRDLEFLQLMVAEQLRIIPTSWRLSTQGGVPYEYSSISTDDDLFTFRSVMEHEDLPNYLDGLWHILQTHNCADLFGLKIVLPSRPQLQQMGENLIQIDDMIHREHIIRNTTPPRTPSPTTSTTRFRDLSTDISSTLNSAQSSTLLSTMPTSDIYEQVLQAGTTHYIIPHSTTHPSLFNISGNAAKWHCDLSQGKLREGTTELRILAAFSTFDIIVPDDVDVEIQVEATFSTCVLDKVSPEWASCLLLITGSINMTSLNVWSDQDPARPIIDGASERRQLAASSSSSRSSQSSVAVASSTFDAPKPATQPQQPLPTQPYTLPPPPTPPLPLPPPPPPMQTSHIMGTFIRDFEDHVVPQTWTFGLVGSTCKLDLSKARFQPGQTDFVLNVTMSTFLIKIPVGLFVEPLFDNIMGSCDISPEPRSDGRFDSDFKLVLHGTVKMTKITVSPTAL